MSAVGAIGDGTRRGAGRILWPREHGAYGQIGLPLAASLAIGTPTLSGALFAAAAAAAFFAHEPLLVWMGRRGARAQREGGGRAGRLGAVLAGLGAALGAGAIAVGRPGVGIGALLPLALAACVLVIVARDQERTTHGELVAGAALSSAAVPVVVAGGAGFELALGSWMAWSLAFACTTAAVRCVVGRAKTGHRSALLVAIVVVATALLGVLAPRVRIVWAAAPVLLASWALLVASPHPRHLRRVGWTLVAGTTIMAALVVVLAR